MDAMQGPRKLKKSGGAQAPLSPKNCPQYSKFCVLLHFYATIFKSQGVHVHPVHPLLRGPWLQFTNSHSLQTVTVYKQSQFTNSLQILNSWTVIKKWWLLAKYWLSSKTRLEWKLASILIKKILTVA